AHGRKKLLELTTCTTRTLNGWGDDGDPGGVARYKWLQVQWYLGISGADEAEVWLFVADTGEIRRYPVARAEDAIASLRENAEDFWLHHVIPQVPAAIDDLDHAAWAAASEVMDLIYPGTPGDTRECPADDVIRLAAVEYDEARRMVDEWTTRKQAAA